MKRRTLVVAALVLVLGAYPAAVWFIGIALESRLGPAAPDTGIKSPYFKIAAQTYHRGWYESTQDVTLAPLPGAFANLRSVPGLAEATANLNIKVHNVIHHGPVCGKACIGLARIDSHLLLDEPLRSALAKIYGAAEPLSITTRLGFSGGGTAVISSPAFATTTPNGGQLTWGGLSASIGFDGQGGLGSLQAGAPRLTLAGADKSSLDIEALTLTSTSHRVTPLLVAGSFDLEIRRLSAAGPGNARPVRIADIVYRGDSKVDGDSMGVAVQLGVGATEAAAVNLKAAHFDFTLSHLQMQALEALNRAAQAFNQQTAGAEPTVPTPADPAGLLAAMKAPAIDLLQHQPELRFDQMSVVTDHGRLLVTGNLHLDGVTTADFAAGAEPKALLAKAAATLEVTLDDAALGDIPALAPMATQLQALAQQGLVTHDGGHWHSTIRYERGALTFDGKPFAPQAPGGAR